MLIKLAFKNAQKSFRDYAVYFFTLVLGVCVFYLFNSIYAQSNIMSVTQAEISAMKALSEVLSYVSVFVAIVLGFLIVYANQFFVKRRKKELGLYLTLGMSKGKISMILMLETSFVAIAALIVGLICGIFGSQLMSILSAKLFGVDIKTFQFIFAPEAAVKSIAYFGLIFVIVMLFNAFAIGKFKLIDLLYGGRKNEEIKLKKTWVSAVTFIISLFLIGSAYALVMVDGLKAITLVLIAIILGSIGTVLFFFSITGILTKLVQTNQRLYFKDLNIFVLRQMSSKINTNFASISVVCIVLLLVIGTFYSGYNMQDIFKQQQSQMPSFDFSFYRYEYQGNAPESIWENLPEEMRNSPGIQSHVEIKKYVNSDLSYGNLGLVIRDDAVMTEKRNIEFISLSDYNALRRQLNLDDCVLPEGQYLVLANYERGIMTGNEIISRNAEIVLNGQVLTPMPQMDDVQVSNRMQELYFVVPDTFVIGLEVRECTLNIQCADQNAVDRLDLLLENDDCKEAFDYFESKSAIAAQNGIMTAAVGFLALYLCVVFLITCAAILAIQQLSEAADNKERFKLLGKLGVERKMIHQALFRQILCYFLFPLLLALVHSVVGLAAAGDAIREFGDFNPVTGIFATAIFVIFVYGGYFIITYLGSKSILDKE